MTAHVRSQHAQHIYASGARATKNSTQVRSTTPCNAATVKHAKVNTHKVLETFVNALPKDGGIVPVKGMLLKPLR